jgi:hypothetical protein
VVMAQPIARSCDFDSRRRYSILPSPKSHALNDLSAHRFSP